VIGPVDVDYQARVARIWFNADIADLQDALINYPGTNNLRPEGKQVILNELAIRRTWAE